MRATAAMNADGQAGKTGGNVDSLATGYAIVLPPGWRRIPLRSGTENAIRAAAKHAMQVPSNVPPDKISSCRLELERRLTKAARTARAKGGIDIYLPAGQVYETPVAASFVVSELDLTPVDHADVVARLAAGDTKSQLVTLDGSDGLRIERMFISASEEPGIPSANVDYVVPVPGRPGRWLTIAFSTLTSDAPGAQLSRLLIQLFDAIMSTFEWERRTDE